MQHKKWLLTGGRSVQAAAMENAHIPMAGERLKRLRKRLRYTLNEAAEVLGYAWPTGYQKLEATKKPYIDVVKLRNLAPLLLSRGATPEEVADLGGVPISAILDTAPHSAPREPDAEEANLPWDELIETYITVRRAIRAGWISPETDEDEAKAFRRYYEAAKKTRR